MNHLIANLLFFVMTLISTNAQIRRKDVPDTIPCQVDGKSGACIAADKCPEAQQLMSQGILPPMCEFVPGLFDESLVCCSTNGSVARNTTEAKPAINGQSENDKTGLILGSANNDSGLEGTANRTEPGRHNFDNKTDGNTSNGISGTPALFLIAVTFAMFSNF